MPSTGANWSTSVSRVPGAGRGITAHSRFPLLHHTELAEPSALSCGTKQAHGACGTNFSVLFVVRFGEMEGQGWVVVVGEKEMDDVCGVSVTTR